MIGIFDSGRGGIASLARIRRALPALDIAYLADRKNAPYGTKSEEELTELAEWDIARLKKLGAEEILIACSTASTVYPRLKSHVRSAVFPIIERTAEMAAAASKNKRIALVATERTVSSGAFGDALSDMGAGLTLALPLQDLVYAVECGAPSGEVTGIIGAAAEKIMRSGADTLVLGCTHFSHVSEIFERELPQLMVVDCAAAGATLMIERHRGERESGRLIYL